MKSREYSLSLSTCSIGHHTANTESTHVSNSVRTHFEIGVSVLSGFQLPTSSICRVAPRAMSFNRESPRHMTMLPGGGSLVRAR